MNLKISLVEKSARIHINDIAKLIEPEWRKNDAIGENEVVIPSVMCEQGAWYVQLTVIDKTKMERKSHIISVNKMP